MLQNGMQHTLLSCEVCVSLQVIAYYML